MSEENTDKFHNTLLFLNHDSVLAPNNEKIFGNILLYT